MKIKMYEDEDVGNHVCRDGSYHKLEVRLAVVEEEIKNLKQQIEDGCDGLGQEVIELKMAVKELVVATAKLESSQATMLKVIAFLTPLVLAAMTGFFAYQADLQKTHLNALITHHDATTEAKK